MCDMRLAAVILTVLSTQALHAGGKTYQAGKLNDIVIKDITMTMPFPTGNGMSIPLHIGINYQFQISADDILYVGSCWSKGKRNYGADWVLKDPVEFRVDKGRLFLKRPVKGELRLAVMSRFRVVPMKDSAGVEQQSSEPLPPFATKQIEPECH